jgi:ribosomal protein S18 acetylase RimI-like enzyme
MTSITALKLRELARTDLAEVARIDAVRTGLLKKDYWKQVFRDFFNSTDGSLRIGLAAEGESGLAGYLLGEVRAFEFGSEACGWIFAVATDVPYARTGVASRLLAETCRRFREAEVTRLRTMVRRNDIPVLSFFRSNGFAGGPYVQLELDLAEV